MTRTIQAVGECMIEFARSSTGVNLAYAGDSYNTAVYLARVSRELGIDVDVRYFTGIGQDRESDRMRQAWAANGVGDDSRLMPGATPGAYLIATDAAGERTFTYWRANSAAAQLFAGTSWLSGLGADWIYLTGITLQLMPPATRAALLDRLQVLRGEGATVIFDSNYRAAGWAGPEAARSAMRSVMRHCEIVLVTLDDETALGNGRDADSCAAALASLGPSEVVVKMGSDGVVVGGGIPLQHVPTRARVAVDTTGAGDSFNGAYLAGRLAGRDPVEAAQLGNRVAGEVVTHAGAIIPWDAMPSLVQV